jgi:hypothetical protein
MIVCPSPLLLTTHFVSSCEKYICKSSLSCHTAKVPDTLCKTTHLCCSTL